MPFFPRTRRASPSTPNLGFSLYRSPSTPIGQYTQRTGNIPLSGAQILLTLGVNGSAQGQVGPAGFGTVWYPASAVISTSVTPFDTSKVNVYVGPAGVPTTLQGSIAIGGSGVISLAIPVMTPGLFIICVWTGGTPGSTVAMNVTGSMTSLMQA